VRNLISAGRDPRFLMPDAVRKVIHDSGVYARKS
jgi:nicotinic acid mononucleotide adenylyltransferase